MDCSNNTSIAAVLAASIIMATTFSDQGSTVRILLLWRKREEMKRISQSVSTLLSYVGQWIQPVICTCKSICCNHKTHYSAHCTCGRNRPAKHYVLRQWKQFLIFEKKRRHSFLTVNTPIQISHHATEHQYVQHTCIKNNSLEFHLLSSSHFLKFLTDTF